MFQMVEQARQNQNNPVEMFKQVTRNYTPQQMDNFFSQAKNMGFSDDLINQIKGINS